MALWNIVNLAGVIEGGVILGESLKKTDTTPVTSFNLAIGHETQGGSNYGGSVPHVALFDTNGKRIGQYKGDGNGHEDSGTTMSVNIQNTQNGGNQAQAEYVHVTMVESDAICVAYVNVAGDSVSWSWLGNWASACDGLPWYYSDLKIGTTNLMPDCVWLDQDGSDGLPFNSLSLHISDFGSSPALQQQYDGNRDTLCKSSPRFRMWNDPLGGDAFPAFFSPPLQYNDDGTDKDASLVIDHSPSKKSRRFRSHVPDHKADNNQPFEPSTFYPKGTNPWPNWLHVSDHEHHDATRLCNSTSSFGPDFVSTSEGTFCNMSAKKVYPLCSAQVTRDCFDLDSKVLKTAKGDEHEDSVSTVERRDVQTDHFAAGSFPGALKSTSKYTTVKHYK